MKIVKSILKGWWLLLLWLQPIVSTQVLLLPIEYTHEFNKLVVFADAMCPLRIERGAISGSLEDKFRGEMESRGFRKTDGHSVAIVAELVCEKHKRDEVVEEKKALEKVVVGLKKTLSLNYLNNPAVMEVRGGTTAAPPHEIDYNAIVTNPPRDVNDSIDELKTEVVRMRNDMQKLASEKKKGTEMEWYTMEVVTDEVRGFRMEWRNEKAKDAEMYSLSVLVIVFVTGVAISALFTSCYWYNKDDI